MPKRKKSATPASEDNHCSPICDICRKLFDQVRKPGTVFIYEFYKVIDLKASATDCQSCLVLWGIIRDKNEPGQKRLSIEARHYVTYGLSLVLGYKDKDDYEWFDSIDFLPIDLSALRDLRLLQSSHTNSQESWSRVFQWNRQCLWNHMTCIQESLATASRSTLVDSWPRRLLALGSNDQSIKLCDINTLDLPPLVYMTLSHCWGQHKPMRLLRDKLSYFQRGINLTDLPPTFRHAVEVTRKMGVYYLWIDSLCIIQDCTQDWSRESSKMHWVYKHSFLNLVAAASLDAKGGLFQDRNPRLFKPCIADISWENEVKYVASPHVPEDQRTLDADSSDLLPTITRGWVFQELLLPSRALIFGKEQLHWYCREHHGTEILPHHETKHLQHNSLLELRSSWRDIHANKGHDLLMELWGDLVNQYSARKVTKFSDRLVAVSGLAAELGTIWNYEYFAGLWSHRLRRGLLWSSRGPRYSRLPVISPVPSWSWGSINGRIFSKYPEYFDGLAHVLKARVFRLDESIEYGQVSGGYIQLHGPLCPAWICTTGAIRGEIDFLGPTGESVDFAEFDLPSMIKACISLDNTIYEETLRRAFVYLAPLEVAITKDRYGISVEGLILVPTYAANGEYKRWGYFAVVDDRLDLIKPNEVLAEQLYEGTSYRRMITSLELSAVIKGGNKKLAEAAAKLAEEEFTRLEPYFEHSDEVQAPTRDDPYGNGKVNKKLAYRYEGVLDVSQHQNVDAFLKFTQVFSEAAVENGTFNEEFYEASHGDGYFTFRIT